MGNWYLGSNFKIKERNLGLSTIESGIRSPAIKFTNASLITSWCASCGEYLLLEAEKILSFGWVSLTGTL